MVSLRNGKKVPFLGENIPKRPRSNKTTLQIEDELELTTRLDSISTQNHDTAKIVDQIKAANNRKLMNAEIIRFVASSKKLIEKIKSSQLHESATSSNDMAENSIANDSSKALEIESSMPECEMTFDLENDTLVKKWDESSCWDETFEVDPLSDVCEQAYNEILNDLIFEDIIYETLFSKNS